MDLHKESYKLEAIELEKWAKELESFEMFYFLLIAVPKVGCLRTLNRIKPCSSSLYKV